MSEKKKKFYRLIVAFLMKNKTNGVTRIFRPMGELPCIEKK
jgi:hypothetical protein